MPKQGSLEETRRFLSEFFMTETPRNPVGDKSSSEARGARAASHAATPSGNMFVHTLFRHPHPSFKLRVIVRRRERTETWRVQR